MTNVVQPRASAAWPPQSRWHGGGNPAKMDRHRTGDLLRLWTFPAPLARQVSQDHNSRWHRAQEASVPGKAFVMAFVWSGWLIASVIAFMIVAYASFFVVGGVGLMCVFLS